MGISLVLQAGEYLLRGDVYFGEVKDAVVCLCFLGGWAVCGFVVW